MSTKKVLDKKLLMLHGFTEEIADLIANSLSDLEKLLAVSKRALTCWRAANNKTELWEAWADNLGEEMKNVIAEVEERP